MVLVASSFFNVYQVRYSPPLEILTSTSTKNQLKLLFKKKVSSYWLSYYCSLCPSYSSLQYFDTTKLLPNKPHPYIVHSGTSEFVNKKTSIILKLLCGRYRLNSLRHKFSNDYSPKCQMCSMDVTEDVFHFLIICPYLDGARQYALLLWKHQLSNIVYNLFHSVILKWSNIKLTSFLLDPMSQFSTSDISPHQNLKLDIYKFAQDYVFSIHRQRQLYYGDWSKS